MCSMKDGLGDLRRQTKFRHFDPFLSTSGTARTDFGGGGRQNSGILLRFCLLRGSREPVLEVTVDKNQAFCPIFVYFGGCAGHFWRLRQTKSRHFSRFLSTSKTVRGLFEDYGRQNQGISPVFCLLRRERGAFLEDAVDKNQVFCSVFVYFGDRAISSSQSSAFHKKRQPKQSTAFKIGSSNPCIKEKGARSEVIKSKQPRIKRRGSTTPYDLYSTLCPKTAVPFKRSGSSFFGTLGKMQSTKTGLLKEKSR